MAQIKSIITHPGAAHRDEVYAIALALAHACPGDPERAGSTTPPILRVDDIQPEDYQDPDVWIIDTGRKHEPMLHNFDHHQFVVEKVSDSLCAFSLVLQHLGLYEYAKMAYPSIEAIEIMDCKGPDALAAHLTDKQMALVYQRLPAALEGALPKNHKANIDKLVRTFRNCVNTHAQTKEEVLMKLAQPLETMDIEEFSLAHRWTIQHNMWHQIHRLGQVFMSQINNFKDLLEEIEDEGEVCEVKGIPVLMIPDAVSKISGMTQVLTAWRKRAAPDAAVSIAPDTKDNGYALYRIANDPRIDFTRVSNDSEIIFTHNSGNLAKTKSKDRDTALRLVGDAVVPT